MKTIEVHMPIEGSPLSPAAPKKAFATNAHTIHQLFAQLMHAGYRAGELAQIRNTMEVASQLFACRFQYSGEPFLVHVIGTASVLVDLRSPAELVAAALIHNAYGSGDFGDGRSGPADWKRDIVRLAVGARVEEYVHEFRVALQWPAETIARLPQTLGSLSDLERAVLLLRLADVAEHHRDLRLVLSGRQRAASDRIERDGEVWLCVANELADSRFAQELQLAFEETTSADVPVEFIRQFTEKCTRPGGFLLPPRSYRPYLSVAVHQMIDRMRDRVFDKAARVRANWAGV